MGFGGFDFSNAYAQGGAEAEHEEAGGGFRDLFSQFFHRGGGPERGAKPEQGSELEYGLNVDFWQAIKGTQVTINVNRRESCSVCGGSGSAGARRRLVRSATARETSRRWRAPCGST